MHWKLCVTNRWGTNLRSFESQGSNVQAKTKLAPFLEEGENAFNWEAK